MRTMPKGIYLRKSKNVSNTTMKKNSKVTNKATESVIDPLADLLERKLEEINNLNARLSKEELKADIYRELLFEVIDSFR